MIPSTNIRTTLRAQPAPVPHPRAPHRHRVARLARAAFLAAAPLALAAPALGQCSPTLDVGTTLSLPAGSLPLNAAVGDFNRDGRLDIVSANQMAGTVTVALGNGNGTFGPGASFAAGAEPYFVIAADFNGDGRLDLAVANHGSGNVSILIGNGNGTFQALVNYPAATSPICVAAGDFNGDGRPDLVVVNQDAASVSILIGRPAPNAGTFLAAVNYSVGPGPLAAVVGDFNSDGRPDLAVANSNDTISVLLGTGTGTFLAAVNYTVGARPRSLAVGDVNGDGRPDLVAANLNGDSLSVLIGNANGTFQLTFIYTSGSFPHSVAIADMNGDGRPDIVTANLGNNTVSIHLNNCPPFTGTFQAPVSWPSGSGPVSVALGDFTGDGRPDVAVACIYSDQVRLLVGGPSHPIVAQQPFRTSAVSGSSAGFSVSVAGAGITYQWRRDGVPLSNGGAFSGANTPNFSINPVLQSDNGATFDCVFTNSCGCSAVSNPAGLAVTSLCPADFNRSGALEVQDIFDFLTAWFAGC